MKQKTLILLVGFLVKFLSGRKNKWTTAEQVKMQMKNRLPAVAARVDNRAITGFGEIFFAGDFRRNQMHIAERFQMFVSRLIERFDMLAGMMRMCVGACGLISLNATQTSSS
jgi:hypothetical protein